MSSLDTSPEKLHLSKGVWLGADFLSGGVEDTLDEKLIQLCGNCAHRIKAFHENWNGKSDSFGEVYCPNCFTACFRHCTVVAIESVCEEWPESRFKDYIKARADVDFWHGEVTSDSTINNFGAFTMSGGYPASIRKQEMVDVVEWSPSCPTCLSDTNRKFEFHHWDYENDIGVQLCQECHEYIHRGMSATEQSKLDGVVGWKADAATRILDRASFYGILTEHPSIRFNIPSNILSKIDTDPPFGNSTQPNP